jgi:hypothetical protein
MNAKYVTLAILIMAFVVLVLPPAISWAGLAQVALQPIAVDPGAAQTENRAALIAQFGDGSYVTRCVSFAEDSIAGLELLTRSGLEVALWGGAVCRIQDEGCGFPAEPCFCQCKGSSCQYWSYWHWRDAGWAYSQIGSGDYRVHNGDVEAWLWGDAQTPPVALSLAEICGPSAGATATVGKSTVRPGDVEAPPRPEDGETPVASTQQSSQGVSLTQYAVFAIMAIALVAGFWFLRGRQGG